MTGQNILTATNIGPQVMVSQQLGTSEAAMYTCASGTSAKVAQGSLCNVTGSIAAPTLTLGTTATSGGTFTAGTYYWKVSAKLASGETLPSAEVTATIATNGTQTFSWTVVPTAVSYNLFRGTTPGGENILVANTAATTYTDTGTAGTSQSPLALSSTGAVVTVYLSIVKSGGTMGDGTHRVLSSYNLAANDTLPLKDYISGAMLGPGDVIAAYASQANAVDLVITGTVHA
jgi:hypothetical protein